MTPQTKTLRDLAIDRICADIAHHQATIASLNALGHASADNEKQLAQLQESLARLK